MITAASGGRPQRGTLAYFPSAVRNPYLEILYAACPDVGWSVRPLAFFSELDDLGRDDVFHIHWTSFVIGRPSDEREASERVARAIERIDGALGRGVRLVWTVHNVLPHECPYPLVELTLRSAIVERADVVHVLNASTVGEVADLYPIPHGKVGLVEHPLYFGAYPDGRSRQEARRWLELEDEILLLAFGSIRHYKGFDRLVNVAPILAGEGVAPFRILIAGAAGPGPDVEALLASAAASPLVSVLSHEIPDDEIADLFHAADVAVLPYRAFHNSGVAMLALTFGTPTLLPWSPISGDLAATDLVTYFDNAATDGLLDGLRTTIARRRSAHPLEAGMASRHDPHTIALAFAALLEARLR